MSTKITNSIDVELDSTEIVPTYPTDIVATNQHCVDLTEGEISVEGHKQEYSVVGDGLYASISAEEAPQWLTGLIDSVVDSAVDRGLINYDDLVQDVRDAIDSIDLARNSYVEEINFNSRVDGIVGSRIDQLNATLGDTYATITNLGIVEATANTALTTQINSLRSELNDSISSSVEEVRLAYIDADSGLSGSITALNTTLSNLGTEVSGQADAISGLRTFVGITEYNEPNGTGMLSRLNILEKQNDGVIEYTISTIDVMTGVDPDDTTPGNNELIVTAEPYATWKAADDAAGTEETRAAHVGDVYIVYSDDENGTRSYVKSYKFIKTAVDETSPLSTDAEGYTWALVTDTDAQAAYVIALNAQDLADSKRRVFTAQPFGPYDQGDLWVDSSVTPQIVKTATASRATSYLASEWVQADQQAEHFITNTYTPDSAQIHRQLDGKIEYSFYESSTDIEDPALNPPAGAAAEARALDIIKGNWTTQELKDAANGNVVYFKDSREAYWYKASSNSWITIDDTSIYEALQDAATAQGAADGKISQFYAWGGNEAPADYSIVTTEEVPNPDDPENPIVQEVSTTYPGNNFKFWYKVNGSLYHDPNNDGVWTEVPVVSGTGTYLSEGDVLTVLDPATNDTSTYSFNGTSWQQTGPTGIISQSKFFIDLENDVRGAYGSTAKALADLQVTTETYTNSQVTGAKSSFFYDTNLEVNGVWYSSGFGLNALAEQDEGIDGSTEALRLDSEFWVNASRFVIKNPLGGPDAVFTPTASGLTLGTEYTEATRNEPKGAYLASTSYVKGDVVSYNGSSYTAIKSVTGIAPDAPQVTEPLDTNYPYWQLLADKGDNGVSYTGTTEYYKLTDTNSAPDRYSSDTIIAEGWETTPQTPTATNKYLWNFNRNTKSDNSVIDSPVSLLTQYVKDGKGISSITEAYQISNNSTSHPTGTWETTIQTPTSANPYLWNRTTIAYTEGDNDVIYTIIAVRGDDGTPADVLKYVYKDSFTKPAKPTDNAATGWLKSIPSSVSNTLWQSVGTQTQGVGDYVWSEVVQITAKDGLSALLFDWSGSEQYNTNTDINGADAWTFESAFAGNAFIRINASDAEGGIRVALNDVELGSMSGPDNAVQWYEFGANNLVVGTNTLKIWSVNTDGGYTNAIKVAFVGAQGIQGITGDFTDFLFTRKGTEPADPGGADTWYTNVTSVPAGSGSLWSIKKKTTNGGSTVEYSDKRVIEADIIRELVLYSGAVTEAVTKPNDTAVTYDFTSDSVSNTDTNWSLSFPSDLGNGKKVYRTTALVSGNSTETAKAVTGWSNPVVYAEIKDGVSYSGTTEYYAKSSNGTTAPALYSDAETKVIDTNTWKTNPVDAAVDATNKYLWNFNRNSKDNNTFEDSTPFVLTTYVKDGKGISSITEAYQIHDSSSTAPTGTWSSTVQTPTAEKPYLWNRTTIVYTEGENQIIYSLIAIRGGNGTAADNYKEIFLYQNAENAPTSLPDADSTTESERGYDKTTGNAVAIGDWTVSASAATAPNHTYRINLTLRQANGTGDWVFVDSVWSGPVQISAIDGVSADTYKEIFIYANSSNAPTIPTTTTGYFNTSSGVATIPAGDTTWTTAASAPGEGEFTWRSSLTIVDENSDGSWAASDTAWNGAVKLTGEQGQSITGPRGTAVLSYGGDLGDIAPAEVTNANLVNYWNTAATTTYDQEKTGDTLIVTNTNTSAGWTHIYEYNGSTWVSSTEFTVNGNMVVDGTLSANAIGTGSINTNVLTTNDKSGGDTYTGVIIDNRGIRVYKDGVARIKIGDLS